MIIGRITHYFLVFRRQISNLFSDLLFFVFFKVYLGVFLLLNATLWFAAYYIKNAIDEPRIALHYNVDFGIDYYGSSNNLFLFPLLGLIFFVLNTSLFALMRNHQDRRLLGHILSLVAVICNVILLVGLASVYLINFK